METDDFWHLLETARSRVTEGNTLDQTLVDLLAVRSQREVLEYQECFDELHGALYRWDVWAAAYLIGGGCSDDGFVDFRAGVIAEGRTWYERVAADPDRLAEHPLVAAGAGAEAGAGSGSGADYALCYEALNYVAAGVFERLTGDEDDFYDAWDEYNREALPRENSENDVGAGMDMGEDFDFRDADQMHRRLPRLAARYLSGNDHGAGPPRAPQSP